MERQGSKICRQTADQIRTCVKEEIGRNGRVDPNLVRDMLRTMARDDADLHQNWNTSFSHGNGPAVIRHK